MNILYLTNHLNIGGISSYTLTLAAGLKRRGHNVFVASSGGELIPDLTSCGITHLALPIKTKSEISYKVFISKFKLSRFIKEKKIDILHANTRVTQVLSWFIQRSLGVPYVSTCHGFFKRRIFRRIFPCWGDMVIAISESVKEHLIKDFGVAEAKIRVIHNGIDVKKFQILDKGSRIETKRKLGLGDGPVIGIVARLSEEKGHAYLIEAMQAVIAEITDAQLLIVGDGRMKEKLINLTKSLGLKKNIFFFPSVTDTRGVLSAMDLFVLPSTKEGLGLALMEAMASGLSVIGSDIGGIKSLIQDGYSGLLTRPANTQDLSCAILELLRHPDKTASFSSHARVFIEQNFSQEKMALETEKVYLKCLGIKE
ncbi:MAG: glycosyltransferase family 4 protein [Candidatus Omnitrophica bacterium]|nr:glycosyltransferase family 4 protein [Candidatus Omnitrophota bacterium]MDD5592419.1 glycosyltransferase family 4 protein [Candidatus Omnitrophota bacterium]